jgi:putative ABC transport system substrate-binding protein
MTQIRKGRRLFVGFAAAAMIAPRAALPQAPKPPHVIWLQAGEAGRKRIRAALAARGLVEGSTIALSFEAIPNAASQDTATPFSPEAEAYVDRIIRSRPAVIVTVACPELDLLQRGTREVPIVFYNLGLDAAKVGLVESLRRPGANITGTDIGWDDLTTRQWQLLKEFVPSMKRGGVLQHDIRTAAQRGERHRKALEMGDENHRRAADRLGFELRYVEVAEGASEEVILDALIKARIDAVILGGSPENIAAARRSKIPACGLGNNAARRGLLVTVSFDWVEGETQAAAIVAQILRGQHPSTIPVYRCTRYGMYVNRATARAIGVKIPDSILIQANEIFE